MPFGEVGSAKGRLTWFGSLYVFRLVAAVKLTIIRESIRFYISARLIDLVYVTAPSCTVSVSKQPSPIARSPSEPNCPRQ